MGSSLLGWMCSAEYYQKKIFKNYKQKKVPDETFITIIKEGLYRCVSLTYANRTSGYKTHDRRFNSN